MIYSHNLGYEFEVRFLRPSAFFQDRSGPGDEFCGVSALEALHSRSQDGWAREYVAVCICLTSQKIVAPCKGMLKIRLRQIRSRCRS